MTFLLWAEGEYYDDRPSLLGVYDTREAAKAAIPNARWVDGEALHPLYDIRWESPGYYQPYIEERHFEAVAVLDAPEGPEFGPPLPPRCDYRDGYYCCTKLRYHDGEHDLAISFRTTSSLIITPSSVATIDSQGVCTEVGP